MLTAFNSPASCSRLHRPLLDPSHRGAGESEGQKPACGHCPQPLFRRMMHLGLTIVFSGVGAFGAFGVGDGLRPTVGDRTWAQELLPTELSAPLRIIPAQSVIAITIRSPITYIPEDTEYSYPMTGFLAAPIFDDQGVPIALEESLVTLQLRPMKGGAQLQAEGIVVGNRLIPIQTSTILIPAQRDPFLFDSQFEPSPGVVNRVANNLLNVVVDSDGLEAPVRAGAGIGLAVISGLSTPRAKDSPKVVNIIEETVYVLTLSEPLSVPDPGPLTPAPALEPEGLEEPEPSIP
jgi:hypothetical protein